MPTYNPIVLFFIRRPATGRTDSVPDRDDCLRIEKLSENNIRVTYTERSADGPIIDTTTMSYQKLTHYMFRLFWVLSLDEDPFDSVQTMIPGYPSFTLCVPAFKTCVGTIVDMILTTCWQWPTISRMPAPPLRDPTDRGTSGLPGTATATATAVAPTPAGDLGDL
jgi:hypothetical protein